MFNHEGPAVVSTMRDLTVGVFEHLETTSPMGTDKRVAYTQITLRGAALKKYKAVLIECKQSLKELAGDNCYLDALKGQSTNNFWAWSKKEGIGYDWDAYLGLDKCVGFNKEVWFELGECMWRKHRSVYHDHLIYI